VYKFWFSGGIKFNSDFHDYLSNSNARLVFTWTDCWIRTRILVTVYKVWSLILVVLNRLHLSLGQAMSLLMGFQLLHSLRFLIQPTWVTTGVCYILSLFFFLFFFLISMRESRSCICWVLFELFFFPGSVSVWWLSERGYSDGEASKGNNHTCVHIQRGCHGRCWFSS